MKNEEDSKLHTQENNEGLVHGTTILKYLLLPRAYSKRGICADSYFPSVLSVEEMMRTGVHFIDVVKTSTKKCPMGYLTRVALNKGRGQHVGVILAN